MLKIWAKIGKIKPSSPICFARNQKYPDELFRLILAGRKFVALIKYLKHREIDIEKWDACIGKAFNGMVYGWSWYLDMVSEDWEALVENDYERVMPLTRGRKMGMYYLFQPRFTQQLGIFSQTLLSGEVVKSFLQAIPEKYRFIEINLNTFNTIENPRKHFHHWKNHELDLINTYENIRNSYSQNLKRNLKKASQSHLTLVKNIKPEDVIAIFRETKGKELENLSDKDYQLLQRLIYVMIYKRIAQVMGVYDETNVLIAGVFFVFSHKKAIFYFSATSAKARETLAMPFLIDKFISENTGSHLTLDFEGSNNEHLARFYRSFGSTEISYFHYRKNNLNPLFKAGFYIYKQIKDRF